MSGKEPLNRVFSKSAPLQEEEDWLQWTNPQLTKILNSTSLDKISSQRERASQN
jgi:hypothetical protein